MGPVRLGSTPSSPTIQDKVADRDNSRKKRVEDLFIEFGFDLEKISSSIMARLRLMNELTNFVEDEEHTIQYAKKLFEYYDHTSDKETFTDAEKRNIVGGLIFSDIGKTGPASANEDQQRLILRLYGIEGVQKEGEVNLDMPIRIVIKIKFLETSENDIKLFQEMGLDPDMPIKELWRQHAGWTKDIIEGDGVPKEEIAIAAIHHILEGDNAYLVGREGQFTEEFGDNKKFDREEKIVILLDKYGAFIDRVRDMTHEKAIEELRSLLKKFQDNALEKLKDPNLSRTQREYYELISQDKEFFQLIDDLEIAFG